MRAGEILELVERRAPLPRGRAGPTDDQLDAVERVSTEHDSTLAEWLARSGEIELLASDRGRPSALYRIYPDGRAVTERTWS